MFITGSENRVAISHMKKAVERVKNNQFTAQMFTKCGECVFLILWVKTFLDGAAWSRDAHNDCS